MRVKDLEDSFKGIILSITRYAGLIPQTRKFSKKVAGSNISNYKIVTQGQLVYGFPINEGVIAISSYSIGAVSPAYQVWNVIREDVDLEFLNWLVKHPIMIAQYLRYATNVVHRRKNLKPQDFRQVLFPLPPLPEQRAIAHVLRRVQEAREATERVIAALRDLKKSLMRHLFTYGPVPVDAADQVELQDTPIGLIPAHWRVVRLGEIYEIQQGKALSRKKDKGIRPRPFLRTANVLWGKVDLKTLDQMDFSIKEEEKYALQNDDLLICEGGEIGRTAIWESQIHGVFYQNHIFRVRSVKSDVYPRFHMYWMETAIKLLRLYRGRSNKTTIPNLSKGRLTEFPIPLPPLPEQRQIARILQAVDRKIEAEEARKEALESLFKTLLHQLMTAKVRLPADFIARFEVAP